MAATTKLLMVGRWLEPYASLLRQLITSPVAVAHTALSPDQEAELAPMVGGYDVLVTNVFTGRLAASTSRLRLLQLPGGGYDRIDFAAVHPGVQVAVCHAHERAIAEFVLMQALVLSRRLLELDRRLRAGDWTMGMIAGGTASRELRGRTMGIIGLGRIGREVASLARSFGMSVIALTRSRPTEGDGVQPDRLYAPERLHDLLRDSDIVVLAVPLNETTRRLIGAPEFAAMKPDALLINPSRGSIVDEEALYAALSSRQIAGAAIDVWYQYPQLGSERVPPTRFPLQTLDNVVMTPHVAGYTEETARGRMREIADNVDRLIRGEPLRNRIDDLVSSPT